VAVFGRGGDDALLELEVTQARAGKTCLRTLSLETGELEALPANPGAADTAISHHRPLRRHGQY
jgi:hypothetical protein